VSAGAIPGAFGTLQEMSLQALTQIATRPPRPIDRFKPTNYEGKLMALGSPVVVHFKEIPNSEKLRQSIEDRCAQLASVFGEFTRFEITFAPLGAEVEAHGRASGKNINLATQATGKNLRAAGDQVFEKLERQLRKIHDKRIFAQRREAQRKPAKRSLPE
jgi:ribosomal subunit interface protein